MAQEQQLPEIKLDATQLYREEIFTDRKAGTLRRLVPVKSDGSEDSSRPVLYSGQTQLLTPAGVLPLAFELEAASLEDACGKFPDAVKVAIEQAIEQFYRAVELGPGFADIRYRLARTLLESGDALAAREELERVVQDRPNFLDALASLGLARYLSGDVAGAEQVWRECLLERPKNARVEAYLAMLERNSE